MAGSSLPLAQAWPFGPHVLIPYLGYPQEAKEIPVMDATLISLVAAGSWLVCCDLLPRVTSVPVEIARKLLHIGTGLLFMLTWSLFPSSQQAAWGAALVPGLSTIRFLAVGLGWVKDARFVQQITRSGDPRELLFGPVQYGFVFVLATLLFFRRLEGVLSLVLLCVGDGFASLIGMKFGYLLGQLPWNRKKSWVGTLAFVLTSLPVLFWYSSLGVYWQWWDEATNQGSRAAIIAATIVGALVESSPLVDRYDNIAIFVVSLLTMQAWPQ